MRAKEHRLGLTIKDFVQEQKSKQREEARAAVEKASAYQSQCRREMDDVLVKNKLPSDWNIEEFKAVIRVIKERSDGAMPKKKPELQQLYEKLKHRSQDLVFYEQVLQCGTGGDTQPTITQDIEGSRTPPHMLQITNDVQMSNTLVEHTPYLDDTHTTYDRQLTRDESEVACVLHGMLKEV